MQIKSLLSKEQLIFFNTFITNKPFEIDEIPILSSRQIWKFNFQLYNFCLEHKSELFADASLRIALTDSLFSIRNQKENIAFIYTDPEDPMVGFDSV
jgi:hypothetical protein